MRCVDLAGSLKLKLKHTMFKLFDGNNKATQPQFDETKDENKDQNEYSLAI